MNLRFEWINWINCVNTKSNPCITADYAETGRFGASTLRTSFVNTGTGGCENRCPRNAPVCVSANRERRARRRALCGRAGARRRSEVAA